MSVEDSSIGDVPRVLHVMVFWFGTHTLYLIFIIICQQWDSWMNIIGQVLVEQTNKEYTLRDINVHVVIT